MMSATLSKVAVTLMSSLDNSLGEAIEKSGAKANGFFARYWPTDPNDITR